MKCSDETKDLFAAVLVPKGKPLADGEVTKVDNAKSIGNYVSSFNNGATKHSATILPVRWNVELDEKPRVLLVSVPRKFKPKHWWDRAPERAPSIMSIEVPDNEDAEELVASCNWLRTHGESSHDVWAISRVTYERANEYMALSKAHGDSWLAIRMMRERLALESTKTKGGAA